MSKTDRDAGEMICEWFALCTNQAVRFEEHPILQPVPICERCSDKTERMK